MSEIRRRNGERVIERWNEVFEAVSAEPRRQLIVSLNDADDGYVSLPESANNPEVPADPETLRRELFHQHLPMLADLGFVEWEPDPLVAAPGPRFEEVAVVFEALQSEATELPDSLVVGCQRLESERQSAPDAR